MICFDLEGPLSPQDNAYEVMRLAKNGGRVFEALSRYDDVLALREKEGYEPGDTLKLIAPFLKHYNITERDVALVSKKARLVAGMRECISWLEDRGQPVRIISTSYEQHAYSIGKRLGLPPEKIACTMFELKKVPFNKDIEQSLKKIESQILSSGLSKKTEKMLDDFYFTSELFEKIGFQVVGGKRKVDALKEFAKKAGKNIKGVVAIGDSITDFKMLSEVRRMGGLAIAFNANQYCLPNADIGVASFDGRALIPVLDKFIDNGKEGAIDFVKGLEEKPMVLEGRFGFLHDMDPPPHYCVVGDGSEKIEHALKIHKETRIKVRGEAGKLG
jgi:energy-converting hydrogenase A subunit R